MPLLEQRNLAVKLQRRFQLAGRPDFAATRLLEALHMFTDADDAVRVRKILSGDQNVSAGASTILTVPAGKRVYLYQIHKASSASTTGINLVAGSNTVRLITAATTAQTWVGRISCEEGWLLQCSQGGAGDTAINCGVMYEEEDL